MPLTQELRVPTTLDAALDYARLGYRVFPLSPGLKRPHPMLAPRGVHDATDDLATLRRWFASEPTANIGLACNGLIVVDCDLGNTWPGVERLRAEETFPVQNTPRGGLHFLFRCPENESWGNSQGRLAAKIDTRARGGYIVVEPSRTIECPQEKTVTGDYFFESPLPPIDVLPLPPDWLVEHLDAAFAPAVVKAADSTPAILSDEAEVSERAIAYLAACPPAVSGQGGHNQTFAVTQALVHGFCLEPQTALRLLRDHYNPRCKPAWSEKELQHKVDSALKHPSDKPRGWLREDFRECAKESNTVDISALLDSHATARPEAAAEVETPPAAKSSAVDARFYIRNDPPAIETIVPFLLDRGDKMFIIGPPKVRKSFFTLQMALSIAGGIDFLGWPIPEPKRVGLIQFEIKAEHFWRRVRRVAHGLGIEADLLGDRLQILNMRGQPPKLDLMPDACDVLIYDPLYKIYASLGADENAATEVGQVLGAVDSVVEAQDVAAVLVHHDAKGRPGDRDSRDRGAGSGVVSRDYDCCVTLTPHKYQPEGAVVIETIQRNYKSPQPFTAVWRADHFEVDEDLAADVETTRSAMLRRQTGPSTEELAEKAKQLLSEPMASGNLQQAIKEQFGIGKNRAKEVVARLTDSAEFTRWKTSTFPSVCMIGHTQDAPAGQAEV